jgi:hypothetical protein
MRFENKMIKLSDFKVYNFSISWTLIDIGFLGSECFKNELSTEDIISYADSVIATEDEIDDLIIELEWSKNLDELSMDYYVKELAQKETVDREIEFRKWRVIYVDKKIKHIYKDYAQGLLELGEIWIALDFPEDSPHIFQAVNSKLTPNQYYTQENYEALLEKHHEWVKKEVRFLKDHDKQNKEN